jgi:hypothetical protein
MNTAFECGIGIGNFNSWEIGDITEAYRMISKRSILLIWEEMIACADPTEKQPAIMKRAGLPSPKLYGGF